MERKKDRVGPFALLLLGSLCLLLVFLFFNYFLMVVVTLLVAIFIAIFVFLILLMIVLFLGVPFYYAFFAKNEIEEYTSYSLDSVRGSEDNEHEKRGRI